MTAVGIRELKAHLAEYIRRAQRGESIVITDRGKAVARLEPQRPEKTSTEERMRQLVAEGLIEWSGEPFPDIEPLAPAEAGFSLAKLVIQEREEHEEQLTERIFGSRRGGRE